jgi:hypothetical protein
MTQPDRASERVDGGTLGLVYVRVDSAADAEKLPALEVVGQVQRSAAWSEWTAPQFEARSAEPVAIGIDGEARISTHRCDSLAGPAR